LIRSSEMEQLILPTGRLCDIIAVLKATSEGAPESYFGVLDDSEDKDSPIWESSSNLCFTKDQTA